MTEKYIVLANGKKVTERFVYQAAFIAAAKYARDHRDKVVEVIGPYTGNVLARFQDGLAQF